MSITPMDIQNKEFERSLRGYDIEDVDDFLDQVAKDLDDMIRENSELKEQILQLQEKNKNYHKLEETMHNAIVVAQETAEEVKQNARREADLIKREAEREAKQILDDARYRSGIIFSEQEELFKQAQLFKMRFRSFIEAQLANLECEDWMDEKMEEPATGKTERKFEPKPDYEEQDETIKTPEEYHHIEPEPEPEKDPETENDQGWEPDFKLGPEDDCDSDPEF